MYRKNLYFGMILFMIGFMVSCGTSKKAQTEDPVIERPKTIPAADTGIAENSKGYKAEDSETLKERPDWVINGETVSKTKGPYYFQARGEGSTIAEASQIAENEVKRQIASYILSTTQFQASIDTATGTRSVIERTNSQKGSRETKEEIVEHQYVVSWIQSSASFSGSQWEDYFWERIKTGNTEKIQYWVRYSITEAEVNAVRDRIRERNNIQQKEAENFNKLRIKLREVFAALDTLSFLEQEALYRSCYEELLAINVQWKELASQKDQPEYFSKIYEMAAAIQYYDPTNSKNQIKQENERLRIEQDIVKNERSILEELYQSSGDSRISASSSVPVSTALTVGSARLHISKAITNGEFLSFLDSTDKPDIFSRDLTRVQSAVNVSWQEAVLFCNWLSRRSGLEEYYTVRGTAVQPNVGRKGYRLPSKEEITAGLDRKVIKQEDLVKMGILGAESNRAYCFDPKVKGLRAVDGAFPANNIGFMVVKND